MILQKANSLKGEITVPGDKSISHRAVMFGALAEGTTEITHFLQGADCLSTIRCFRSMGISIENDTDSNRVLVYGKGLRGLKQPDETLDVGNSGTTMRLMSGILCGQSFSSTMTGDESIQKRPMGRVITPLAQMGADIKSLSGNGCAPLLIQGQKGTLRHIAYESPVASAQVKSAILLAGLYGDGPTSVTEPYVSRNHTELMLKMFGAEVETKTATAFIRPDPRLHGEKITVPGDISSAAYFIAAGLMIPGSEILLRNVGINPTRDGILRVCRMMGADIHIENVRNADSETAADILVRYSELKGTEIGGGLIPALIDELPVIAVMACLAKGKTVIKDAAELKVKESNRIDVMVHNLSLMGAKVTATEDGMVIEGEAPLKGAVIDSKTDHRIAMSFAIAALAAEGNTEIRGAECANVSYPDFYSDLKGLIH